VPPPPRERGLALCGYSTSTRFGELVVAVQHPGRDFFEERRAEAQRSSTITVPPYRRIAGLGDAAFAAGGRITVLQRDTYLVVFAQNSLPEFESVARSLASRALRELN
jgi:hypothetical protein